MRILITGGAGFIGSHLAEDLCDKHRVLVVDNLATGKIKNLQKVDVGFWECGIERMASVNVDTKPADIIIHAAASYKDPNNWQSDIDTNVTGTANILKLAKMYGVKKIIYFQTSLCYGANPPEQPITVDCPINPAPNSYAITKTAAEQLIQMSGIPYVSFRLANCYGPRNLSGPPPTFFKKISKGEDGFVVNTRRDYIYIKDLVNIVYNAVHQDITGVFHIATGSDYSIEEIYREVADACHSSSEPQRLERGADDVPSILLDPLKTIRAFNYTCAHPLKDGIEKAVEWYYANGVGETYTHLKGME